MGSLAHGLVDLIGWEESIVILALSLKNIASTLNKIKIGLNISKLCDVAYDIPYCFQLD